MIRVPSLLPRAVTVAAVLCIMAACASAPSGQGTRTPPPNVVFILTDDQRWDALSCAGHPHVKTPHLDRLASEGVRFSNMFVTTSLCSPSRASFLSGLYPHAHGVLNNFTDYPADLPSFPRALHDAGYETAYVGKWHMGEQSDEKRPGFDTWISHKGQGTYRDTEFNVDGRRRVVPGYYTTVATDFAVEWLKRPHPRPFLLILGHKAPHSPNEPEPKYAAAFDGIDVRPPATVDDTGEGKPDWVRARVSTWHGIRGPLWGAPDYATFVRRYWATILSVDDSVGRVYDTLRETGALDRTLFVFASDNGFHLGEHGAMDKRTMYEESIRVPLLVRYPPLAPAGRVVPRQVLNIDLAPSVLDVCGLPRSALGDAHGRSWKRLLQGDASGWRTAWHYAYNYEKQFPYTPNVRGVRTDEWKYVHYPPGDGGPDRHRAELYNIKDDPGETRNRIADPAAAETLAALQAELDRLLRDTGALPDRMPVDEGVKQELPEQKIR